MRTLNVMKKGLDSMVSNAQKPLTGRLSEEGRAIDGVRRAFPAKLVTPPRKSRFGAPLALSRVHWTKPELVAGVTYVTWTDRVLGAVIPEKRHTDQRINGVETNVSVIFGEGLFGTRPIR